MYTFRRKPELLGVPSQMPFPGSGDQPLGCFWQAVILLIAYFVLNSIIKVTSNLGNKLDQVICYAALIFLVIILVLGVRDMRRESKAKHNARVNWAVGCKTDQLTILGRHEAVSWWDDYANRYHNAPNYLELEMNGDQAAVSPNQTTIRVEVDGYVYDRLKTQSTVQVYYEPEAPLTFLLREEL